MQGSGDPRFGYPRAPHAAPAAQPYAPQGSPGSYPPAHSQSPAQYGQPQTYGQQPQTYGQQPQAQYGQPQTYGQPQQAQYGQPQMQQQQMQQQQGYAHPAGPRPSAPPPAAAPQAGWGGNLGVSVGGIGVSMPGIPGMNSMAGAFAKAPTGLPPVMAFGMAIAAVLIALVFDVIFLKVHIPGIGGYAWYLTTALSFAGAGFGAMKMTRASKKLALTAIGVAAALYGVADLGLGLVLEDLTLGSALFLGIQGVVIAIVTGGGGVHRGGRAREAEGG